MITDNGNRPFYKLRHEHHLPHFQTIAKVIKSFGNSSHIFINTKRSLRTLMGINYHSNDLKTRQVVCVT